MTLNATSAHWNLELVRSEMPNQKRRYPLGPRKPPTQERAAQTVRAILESAADLLESEGLSGYNTNAIAARAGVSIGSVYQYFDSKDAITRALISSDAEALVTAVAAASKAEDPHAALDRLIAATTDHQLRRPRLAPLLNVERQRLYRPATSDNGQPVSAYAQVAKVVERIYGPHAEMSLVCCEVVAIVGALCDAGTQGCNDSLGALKQRIRTAVRGYLRVRFESDARTRSEVSADISH